MNKENLRSRHFIIYTMLAAVLSACLNQGCSKPQEEQPTTTHSTAEVEEHTEHAAPERKPLSSDSNADEQYYKGIESAKKGDIGEAIAAWEKAVEIDPKFIKAHNYLARSYYTMERFDEALSEYKKIVELEPDNAMALVSIGFVCKIKEMYDEAISACTKALLINHNLASAYYCIGQSYVQKKMCADAVDAYKKALEINPSYADAYFGLGIAYECEGKTEEAKQAFETFDELKEATSGRAPAAHAH